MVREVFNGDLLRHLEREPKIHGHLGNELFNVALLLEICNIPRRHTPF